MGAANVAEQLGSFHILPCPKEVLHGNLHSPTAAAAGAHHFSTEDAEVAAITLSGGQPQLGLPLLHHLEAILGHQQQCSSCRSTPPVLPGGGSSKCCTPAPGRRSCSALELAAIVEGYIQLALSPSAAAQPPANRHSSTLAVNSGNSNSQQQHSQQEHHPADSTMQQQRAHKGVSTLLLPPRVQISSENLKQRLLVEPPSSPQLLPYTRGRSAVLLSAAHDIAGALDLDPETPKLLSPAAQAAGSHTVQGYIAAAGSSVAPGPGAARLAAIEVNETCTAAAAAAAGTDVGGWHADSDADAAADMHSHSPLVVVVPPAANQPSSHGTERWRAAVNERADAAAGAAEAAALGSRQSSMASPGSVSTGSDRGRPMSDGKGRLRVVHADIPGSRSTAATTGAGGEVTYKLQQQRSHSSSMTSSKGHQGRRDLCRSLCRGAAASRRNCSSSCDMHGNTLGTVPAGSHATSSRGGEGGVRRSSGGGCGRARKPAGPLELDPCAPPLGSSKLSQPDLADVDYIVHRWSHRWQWDRQHQVTTSSDPTSVTAAGPHHTSTAVMPAGAAAAASKADWVRSPEQLQLFGASPVSGLAPLAKAVRP